MKKSEIKKSKSYKIEQNLITLKNIKCPPEVKRSLRKAAKDWIKFIKQHISEIHKDGFFKDYHIGEISFIELFFNIKDKN